MVADRIEREIVIAAARERVWEVLTRTEFPATRIEQAEPPATLTLRRTPDEPATLIEFTLTPEPGGHTRLRVVERGPAGLPQDDADWTQRLTELACRTERLTRPTTRRATDS
ncbi:hypothetical protein [Kitasatospora sp. NPDC093806]|uniref:hypothetical protein n=1 Tax=Kitasatospora sp. NPDC093806 TaxID=3155075 RepID=UPI0034294121